MKNKKRYHYLNQNIASNRHNTRIAVIGTGGTGSHVINNLAIINRAMIMLDMPPLHVVAYDDDIVEPNNVGRQDFSVSDIGSYKSSVVVSRVNRYYGTQWDSVPEKYNGRSSSRIAYDIFVSCVDSVQSRRDIYETFLIEKFSKDYNSSEMSYWMDIGNTNNSGQVILGTIREIKQPNKMAVKKLPTFFDEYKGVSIKESKNDPGCSYFASLQTQDLFINKLLATAGTNILWSLFKDYRISYRGIYLNLQDLKMQGIPIN